MTARRVSVVRGRHAGRPTLEQRFVLAGADAEAVVDALLSAPLVGERSVFGDRPGQETGGGAGRRLGGFSPAPGFRFDVELTPAGDRRFVVRFAQPGRRVPYLQGGFTWTVRDGPHGAELDEQINTPDALAVAGEPLGGPRRSLRRWLFFRVGHAQVMKAATANLAALAGGP